MSITNSIQLSLNIKEKFLHFNENCVNKVSIRGIETLIYSATLSPPTPSSCPLCGCINDNFSIQRYGFKLVSIKIPSISNYNAILKVHRQRYFCKYCNQTFSAQCNLIEPNCSISKNTKLSCILDMKNKTSIVDIAKRHNISHGTVNNLLKSLNENFIVKKNYLPPHLSMDEFKSVKSSDSAMSFVFLDATSAKVLDIVEDRRLHSLIRYFMSYSRKARASVKTVCIDMYSPYIQLIKSCFPNAIIITDRFHIIQLLSRALNKTRVELMNKDKKNYNKLKRYWKLLLKNYDDLDCNEFRKFTCFQSLMRENDVIHYLVDLDQTFHDTYWLYQDLYSAFCRKDTTLFTSLLHNATATISLPFKTSIKTLLKHIDSVCNALVHPYSNGKIEGTNNLIKVIKRIAFGYRNFSTFRARILLISNTMVRLDTKKSCAISNT